jgi:nicotinate phosphoribosyltransferase
VLADALFGIPIVGTMAHSFIEAHDSEQGAFIDFCLANSNNTTVLIDTYDTLAGARKVVEVAQTLAAQGIRIQRVRLDSGDFLPLSREVRQILDAGGCQDIQIFVSGNMDEFSIKDLLDAGAPIDGFGVGTKLDTSADAPYLECAYKLTEYAGRARMKTSTGKVSLPGRKQVYREYQEGRMAYDTITLMDDPIAAKPLLEPVMLGGKRVAPPKMLADIVRVTRDQLAALPAELRGLDPPSIPYPVRISTALDALRQSTEHALSGIS